jgi:hypothetical protein
LSCRLRLSAASAYVPGSFHWRQQELAPAYVVILSVLYRIGIGLVQCFYPAANGLLLICFDRVFEGICNSSGPNSASLRPPVFRGATSLPRRPIPQNTPGGGTLPDLPETGGKGFSYILGCYLAFGHLRLDLSRFCSASLSDLMEESIDVKVNMMALIGVDVQSMVAGGCVALSYGLKKFFGLAGGCRNTSGPLINQTVIAGGCARQTLLQMGE